MILSRVVVSAAFSVYVPFVVDAIATAPVLALVIEVDIHSCTTSIRIWNETRRNN